jgi:hypothetical protein
MIKVHCNSCEHAIEGPQMAKTGVSAKIDNVDGAVSAHFTFQGPKPDLCNRCLLGAFARLLEQLNAVEAAKVVQLPAPRRKP